MTRTEEDTLDGKERVAMLVFNPCAPDYRVTKQAEHLASMGKDVRIYCLKKEGLPDTEIINGVEYRRFQLDWAGLLKAILKGRAPVD